MTLQEHYNVSWNEVEVGIRAIATQLNNESWLPDQILYVDRGGRWPAVMLRDYIKLKTGRKRTSPTNPIFVNKSRGYVVNFPYKIYDKKRYLVVDDIYDTGKTYVAIKCRIPETVNVRFAFLFIRDFDGLSIYDKQSFYYGHKCKDDKWLDFPWEDQKNTS